VRARVCDECRLPRGGVSDVFERRLREHLCERRNVHCRHVRLRERDASMRIELYRVGVVLHQLGLHGRNDVCDARRSVRVSLGNAHVRIELHRFDAVLFRRGLRVGNDVPVAGFDVSMRARLLRRGVRLVRCRADLFEWSLRRVRRRRATVLQRIVFERRVQRRHLRRVRWRRTAVLFGIVVHRRRVQ
jgi:hypothetical protein